MKWRHIVRGPQFLGCILAGSVCVELAAWCFVHARVRQFRAAIAALAQERAASTVALAAPEDRETLAEKLRWLEARLQELRGCFTDPMDAAGGPPTDSVAAYLAIANFVADSRAAAARLGVRISDEEHFGFERWRHEGPPIDGLAAMHRQAQLAGTIVRQLFAASPAALLGIKHVSGPDTTIASLPATAAQPGEMARDTIEVDFTGDHETVRAFLNGVSAAPGILIVRHVTAEPADETPATAPCRFRVAIESYRNAQPPDRHRTPPDPFQWPHATSARPLFSRRVSPAIPQTKPVAATDLPISRFPDTGRAAPAVTAPPIEIHGWIVIDGETRALLVNRRFFELRLVAEGDSLADWGFQVETFAPPRGELVVSDHSGTAHVLRSPAPNSPPPSS